MPPDTESSYRAVFDTLFGRREFTMPFVQSSNPPTATTWVSYTGPPFDVDKLAQAINRLADVLERLYPVKEPDAQPPESKPCG